MTDDNPAPAGRPADAAASGDPVVVTDGRIDVADVMARIRGRLLREREIGKYSDDEVDELAALKLQAFSDESEIDPELLARLMAKDHNWNISTDYRIETHRQGLAARTIVLAKSLVRPFVRLYTDQPLSRQAQINQYLLHVSHHLARDVVRLQLENTALQNRCRALEEGGKGDLRPGAGDPPR